MKNTIFSDWMGLGSGKSNWTGLESGKTGLKGCRSCTQSHTHTHIQRTCPHKTSLPVGYILRLFDVSSVRKLILPKTGNYRLLFET